MKYLVLSDIHGNWSALEAVLENAPQYDDIFFVGDAVGYYPDADKVVSWLRHRNVKAILGNHDAWMLDPQRPIEGQVMEIIAWQRERLSPENMAYLQALPWTMEVGGAHVVHGSPIDPFKYLEELSEAKEGFDEVPHRFIFIGHTHLAGIFQVIPHQPEPWYRYQPYHRGGEAIIAPKARAIINPGSVGQPRDDEPGAAYAIWDTSEDSVQFYRQPYDFDDVKQRMEQEKFPMWLYERLLAGK